MSTPIPTAAAPVHRRLTGTVARLATAARRTATAVLLAALVLGVAALPAAASTPTAPPAPGTRPVHTVPGWIFVVCGVVIVAVAVVGALFVLRARRNLPPPSGDTP